MLTGIPASIDREGGEPLDVLVDLVPARSIDGRPALAVKRCQDLDGRPIHVPVGVRLRFHLDADEVAELGLD